MKNLVLVLLCMSVCVTFSVYLQCIPTLQRITLQRRVKDLEKNITLGR